MRKHMLAVPVLIAVLAGSAVGVTAQDEAGPDGLVIAPLAIASTVDDLSTRRRCTRVVDAGPWPGAHDAVRRSLVRQQRRCSVALFGARDPWAVWGVVAGRSAGAGPLIAVSVSYACAMARFEHSRSAVLGPAARPVAIPDDVDRGDARRASGVVVLPLHVRWSGPPRRYDLAQRADRALVYEQVLTEGTDDDVRWFVDVDQLVELWSDLVLPGHVRRAWAEWLKERRGITLPC